MPDPVPPVLRTTARGFYDAYRDRLQMFEDEHEVAPGVFVRMTGGHTPGHSVVELVSGGERLLFAGDAMFPVGFDHPDWQNGFEHDPEKSAQVRLELFRYLVETKGLLVAAHLPFPSVGRVVEDGEAFRWVPVLWDY
jgi:glyoxylase-like metal-dependent hydrolase (beta-lactamase superfamily II)